MSYNVSHDKLMPPCILATEFVASPAVFMGTNFAEKWPLSISFLVKIVLFLPYFMSLNA